MKASLRWLKILFVFVFIIGLGAGATYFFLRYKLEKSFDQKIKIISRIPELEVSLAQEDQLLDLLKKRKFFKNGAVFYDQATGWVYPEKLLIILTNEVQSKGRVIGKDENQVYRSYDVGFSDGQYQIFLHWSPLIWQRDEGLSRALTQDVVKSILRVTKKPDLSKKEFLSDQEKEVIKNYSSNLPLFEVKKNQNHTWLQKIKKLIISPVWAICSGGTYRCGDWQTQGCYCPGYPTFNSDCQENGDFCGPTQNILCAGCSDYCNTGTTGNCGGLSQSSCGNECSGYECQTAGCSWSVDPTLPPWPTSTPGGDPTPVPTNPPPPPGPARGKFAIWYFNDLDEDGYWDSNESRLATSVSDNISVNVGGNTYTGREVESYDYWADMYWSCSESPGVCTSGICCPYKVNGRWRNEACRQDPSGHYHNSCENNFRNGLGARGQADLAKSKGAGGGAVSTRFIFYLPNGWRITRIRYNTFYSTSDDQPSTVHLTSPGATSFLTTLYGFNINVYQARVTTSGAVVGVVEETFSPEVVGLNPTNTSISGGDAVVFASAYSDLDGAEDIDGFQLNVADSSVSTGPFNAADWFSRAYVDLSGSTPIFNFFGRGETSGPRANAVWNAGLNRWQLSSNLTTAGSRAP